MSKTIIMQDCTQVLTAPETYSYKIETTVTDKGELPFVQIFVYTIVDGADPTADTFARVGTPGDLDGTGALLPSRDDAVAAGMAEFLSSYFSVQFPDLTIAAQAKSAITTRINDLINNWILYRDQFMLNSGVDQYFPTTDPAFEQTLKDAYSEAKQARITASEDLATSITDLALAEKDATNAQAVYDIYKSEVDFCQKTRLVDWAALDNSLNNIAPFVSASKVEFCTLASLALSPDIVVWPPTGAQLAALLPIASGAYNDWYNSIFAFESSPSGYGTVGNPARIAVSAGLLAFCQTAAAKIAWAYNTKVSADSLVADAVTTKKEAEASLAAAQAAEVAALARAKEACPTFDPASV